MFNKMQTDNHNLRRKNPATNEKQILKKMSLKFPKIAFYMYFVTKYLHLWSREAMGGQDGLYETSNSG